MTAFVVAGISSGVGKTTISLALIRALQKRGLRVQPFKCGPDFLDTGHHGAIAGRPARNLDTWLLSADANREIFSRGVATADAAVVEGMMGLFDGVAGGTEAGSSAEIAKLLGLPVILVLDASRSARSIAAVVKGFATFDPDLRVAGVVLNCVANERHFTLLRDAIVANTDVAVLGWFPRSAETTIPERHLGLRTAEEMPDHDARAEKLATLAESHLDIEKILALKSSRDFVCASQQATISKGEPLRIGVPRDEAFSFYYEDNFDLLRDAGAELVFFSALRDAFPKNLDALYIGGGYPELHAERLRANTAFLLALQEFVNAGKPVYAECGGLMLLGKTLTLRDGQSFAMSGVIPVAFTMTERLVHFGYAEVEMTEDCPLGARGTRIRGHSFHYSRAEATAELKMAYQVRYSLSGREEQEGYLRGNVFGSYIHLHLRANPLVVNSWMQCIRTQKAALAVTR